MMQVFNTNFEVSMRLLLLLNNSNVPLDEEKMLYLDYFTIYGKNYGLANENLNGDGLFMINSFSSQIKLIKDSIKELVLQDLINVENSNQGFLYSINNDGKEICRKMNSDYSNEYKCISKSVLEKYKNKSIKEIKQFAKNKEEEINNGIY